MPCMCGDPYCWSCGPAQGNSKCPICGMWSADGGCENPEECNRKAKEEDDAYAKDIEEAARLADAWNKGE